MKVAIDISPTTTGHSVRGIGAYTKNLVEEFKKGGRGDIKFEFFQNPAVPPPTDLVHYPYFDLFFHTLPVKTKISRVVTIHDVIPLVFPEHFPAGFRGNISLFLQKLSLRNTDVIICDSETSKGDIITKLSIPKHKVHVIYLAPNKVFAKINDRSKLNKTTNKYKLPEEFVLYVGDVNWSKNIPNLLKAIKKSGVNLVMVGKALVDSNLAETQNINKLIAKLNLTNKVTKVGFVEDQDLVAIYNLALVTLLPSYYEGFGLPVLESMACGTPVVCSNVASLLEIGKSAAIFCNPAEPDDISIKITEALKGHKRTTDKLIKHASKFTWKAAADETIDVYKSVFK